MPSSGDDPKPPKPAGYATDPVWITYILHGGKQITERYASLSNGEDSLRYVGIGKERILKVSRQKVEINQTVPKSEPESCTCIWEGGFGENGRGKRRTQNPACPEHLEEEENAG